MLRKMMMTKFRINLVIWYTIIYWYCYYYWLISRRRGVQADKIGEEADVQQPMMMMMK